MGFAYPNLLNEEDFKIVLAIQQEMSLGKDTE